MRDGSFSRDRLIRRAAMVTPVVIGVGVLALSIVGRSVGVDFRHGMWIAGKSLLAGHSPNPQASVSALTANRYAFIPPPPLAWIAVPLSVLPFPLALALWDLVSAAALVWAFWLVGVRDLRLGLALCSLPFVLTLGFGQTEGVLALGLAMAWRWRDSIPGAIAVGVLIAAKVLFWPLLPWLVLTRRLRLAGVALTSASLLLIASWVPISFAGALSYPALLLADARSAAGRTHSITSLLFRLGVSGAVAQFCAVAVAGLVALSILRRSQHSDFGGYVAAVAFALLSSTLLEMHYLTFLLVPLAIARPRLDALWLVAIDVFWISPQDPASSIWQIAAVLVATAVIVWRTAPTRLPRDQPPMWPTALSNVALALIGRNRTTSN